MITTCVYCSLKQFVLSFLPSFDFLGILMNRILYDLYEMQVTPWNSEEQFTNALQSAGLL